MLSEFQSYLYGLILTDGTIYETTRNRGRIQIELNVRDKELLEKLHKRIPSTLTERQRDTNFKKNVCTATLSIFQKPIRDEIISWGIPKHDKSIAGTIPNQDYNESAFWRGVFDGNGSIGLTNLDRPFLSFAIKSEDLKDELIMLFNTRFDIRKNVNRNKRDSIYNICLFDEDAITFAEFLYQNASIYMERKFQKYIQNKTWKRTKKKMHQTSWSQYEINYIQTHSIQESMTVLKRTESSIKNKLYKLKQSNNS